MKFAQNFAILYWIRKNAKGQNDKKPIYCRVTLNGRRTEIATGIYVDEKTFNPSTGFVKGTSKDAQIINAQLDDIRNRLRRIFKCLEESENQFTTEMLRDAFLGKAEERKTILEAMKWHNDMFQQKVGAGNRAPASMVKFKTTSDKLKAFIKWQFKTNDIPLASIKASFAEDFEHYLTVVDKLEHNTTMKYIRNVKKVLIMAVQKEWIQRNPISDFKCSYHNPHRSILLDGDLEKLINTPMPIKRLEEVRDCFVVMCYTGFAFQDAASLTQIDIKLKIDGKRWLVRPRTKTGVEEYVPILPIVDMMINKYKNHPVCITTNHLFPFNSNQKMNAYLKEVGDLCNIAFPLTTHLARHTFATTVALNNGVPLETVQVLLGHRSIRTTQIYTKVLGKKVSDDMADLKKKLSTPNLIKSAVM